MKNNKKLFKLIFNNKPNTMPTVIKILILLIFVAGFNVGYGQEKKDCSDLLKKEVTSTAFINHTDAFVLDFQKLIYCEFDSIDYQLFMGTLGNQAFLASSILSLNDNVDNKEHYTFKDLRNLIIEFKKKDEYVKARNVVDASNILLKKTAMISNWETDKILLEKIGLNDIQLSDIKNIICSQEQEISYQEIFKIYTKYANDENELKSIANEQLNINNTGKVEFKKGLYAYPDYKMGLEKSQELKKPALVYFNCYGCVNAREIESLILSKPQIKNYINENYTFINVFVDDRTKVLDENVYYSDVLKRNVKYVGDLNLEIEVRDFNSDRQPLFVIISIDGKEISRIEYTKNMEEFESFLKQNK